MDTPLRPLEPAFGRRTNLSLIHIFPFIKDMHDAHHADQTALVGTPTWLSFVIVVAFVFAPMYALTGLLVATGITAGVTLGYLDVYKRQATLIHSSSVCAWAMLPGPMATAGMPPAAR